MENNKIWIPKEEYDFLNEYGMNFFYYHLENEKQLNRKVEKDLKYAWIKVDEERIICMIDKNTNIAYKLASDAPVATEETIDNYTFERWCTSMDL